VLYGLRPDGRPVDVTRMSDGTVDQLYLCLRLATLERYLEKNEPMLFVVDDILIRLDDDRSMAAHGILSDLSLKTQILFLLTTPECLNLPKKLKGAERSSSRN
jgi:uncharacterized protein YhaN